jgi:hypothetical protein
MIKQRRHQTGQRRHLWQRATLVISWRFIIPPRTQHCIYALGSYHHRIEVSNPSMSRYRGVAFIRVHSHTLGAPSSARRGMRALTTASFPYLHTTTGEKCS